MLKANNDVIPSEYAALSMVKSKLLVILFLANALLAPAPAAAPNNSTLPQRHTVVA